MVLRQRQIDNQETMRLPDPAAPPVDESIEPRPKKVEASAPPPAQTESAEQEAADEADAAASASASGAPISGAPGSLPAARDAAVDAGAAPADTIAPDGGWQKPAWAQPDNEITIRRGPDQADEKIVLPAEKTEQR